jgi:hypothetical protein
MYKRILKDLGMPYENPTSGERETIDKWLDVYQFEIDFILQKIRSVTKKVRSPNMNYLDKVFTSEFTGEKPDTFVKPAQNKSPRKNTFHNFENASTQLSEEELENLLLKNK